MKRSTSVSTGVAVIGRRRSTRGPTTGILAVAAVGGFFAGQAAGEGDHLKRLSLAGLVRIEVSCPDLSLYADFNSVYRTCFDKGLRRATIWTSTTGC